MVTRIAFRFPRGSCQCGCGQPTKTAQRNDPRYGHIAGQPVWFRRGHARRVPFHLAYEIDPATQCWNWLKSVDRNGYGQQFDNGILHAAHRYSYEEAKGLIPKGMDLDHLCRNPRCVNPDHLEPVSNAENTRRGRTPKLSMEKAGEIRRLYERGGVTQVQLAAQFSVAQSIISKVILRQLWA